MRTDAHGYGRANEMRVDFPPAIRNARFTSAPVPFAASQDEVKRGASSAK